jgi:hypothetical protein
MARPLTDAEFEVAVARAIRAGFSERRKIITVDVVSDPN